MVIHFLTRRLSLAVLAAFAWAGAHAAPGYTLQHFAGDGVESPDTLEDINDAGVVVGMYTPSGSGLATFAGGVITPLPNSDVGYAPHINALGQVSADVSIPDHNYAGIWWTDGTQTLIKVLGVTAGWNAKGQLVGQESVKTQQVGIWEAGVYRRLPPLEGHPGSVVSAINEGGVVVGYTNGVSPRPVQWDADGTVHRLGSDDEVGIGQAVDINNQGHVIGCTDVLGCFLKKGNKFKKLPKASGHKVTAVVAVNDDDVVLAHTYSHSFKDYVIYCNGSSYLFKELLGEEGTHWSSMTLKAMNSSAQIVGVGFRDGVLRNLIATMTTPCN